MNTLSNCPICHANDFAKILEGIDHTVSQETFTIVECKKCSFQFTNPIPELEKIGTYYKSEGYVSHTSSKKGIINRVYHVVRGFTLKQKVKLIKRFIKGCNVLDIGAGTGHFVKAVKESGFNIIGLEPDIDARRLAKTSHNIDLLSIEELYHLDQNSQDIITMWHVLEHVYNLEKDVLQISKVLKDDGTLVVAVPNKNSYDAQRYGKFWAAYDLPIHLYHFTPNDIKNLFQKVDIEVKHILPMKFDSYYVSMLSEKYRGGNLFKALWSGMISNLKAKEGTYSSQIYILQKKH